jgi:hypothetical protein
VQKPVLSSALQNYLFFMRTMERQADVNKILLDEGFLLSILNLCSSVGCGLEARQMFDLYRYQAAHVPVHTNAAVSQRVTMIEGVRRPRPACYHATIHACVGAALQRRS